VRYSQADIDAKDWFHGIDFGNGLRTKGRVTPENWSLYGAFSYLEDIPLKGVRLLDIGTMDGIVSFIAERGGASEVIATDLYDRKTMRMAIKILNSSVQYQPSTSVEDLLPRFGAGTFDIVVMGGLLYHLVSPLRAILIGRHLLKEGGILILETVATEDTEPKLLFNPAQPVIDEYTTYFVPSLSAVREMATFCSFNVLGSNKTRPSADSPYVRGTILARAVLPDNANSTTSLMGRARQRAAISKNDRILDEFNLATLKDTEASVLRGISIPEYGNDIAIDRFTFVTTLPFQPR